MSEITSVQDSVVVSMDYTLRVDGDILDTSSGREPLQFIQGVGNIIPGLEKALYGMTVGQRMQVVIAPADGYGDFEEDALVEVPRAEFPEHIPLEVGLELQVRGEEGHPMMAHVLFFDDQVVRLDFNHPLAGKELHFDITITDLRSATSEEMEHGHVHFPGHSH